MSRVEGCVRFLIGDGRFVIAGDPRERAWQREQLREWRRERLLVSHRIGAVVSGAQRECASGSYGACMFR